MLLINRLYLHLMRKRIFAANVVAAELLCNDRKKISQIQVDRFNTVWSLARRFVPFYQDWQRKYNLPDSISSLQELRSWPILTKADLRNVERFVRLDVNKPSGQLITGGSTGEPVRLPSWNDYSGNVSQIIGRGRYGVNVGDRLFLLWGHEHLYGKGCRRTVKILIRRFKDFLAGWVRVSAYDLSSGALHRAYEVFIRSRARAVIGFSPAVLSFVRVNKGKGSGDKNLKLKAVICTAGPLTVPEKREISNFFHAPVVMEYGSVECSIMAYTKPKDEKYWVFWNTHLIQAVRNHGGEFRNIVTRLTDCYVPLIRYDVGDYLSGPDNDDSVLSINDVIGRPSEMIHFACGVSFFGALIGDCVKQVPEILSSQIAVKECANVLEVRVVASVVLPQSAFQLIINRISLTIKGADLLTVRIVQVDKLVTTTGGKIPRVVRL